MITYQKAIFTDEVVESLLSLSSIWANEEISFGLVPNTKENLKEPCFIALDNKKVVGYIFGHFYKNEKKISCKKELIKIGEPCFDIDELYVLKEYRNKGIGKELFALLEKEVKDKVNYITLGTSTMDYRKILHFYIEEVDMTFHSAFLFKKVK